MKIIEYNVSSDGFRGQLFDPGSRTDKVIIVFLGGEGRFISSGLIAEKFADNGYAALALYYWKGKGLPTRLNMIPLDMVEKAIAALKQYNGGQFEKIGTYGVSVGSILALMSGVVFSDISAVVAVSPTHIIPEGFLTRKKTSGESFLTYRGEPYYYTPLDDSLSMYEYFSEAYKSINVDSLIPVESIKGLLFLAAGQCDEAWPASVSLKEMKQRLESSGKRDDLHIRIYENGGHYIGVMPDLKKYKRLNLLRLISKHELLHPKSSKQAREQSENDILQFLSNW